MPHHSCSTLPPRACLASHARTGAWALIVEPSHKSDRYPCLHGVHVSFSSRFISLRDLHEPSVLTCALAWNPLRTPRALLSWTCQHDQPQHFLRLVIPFRRKKQTTLSSLNASENDIHHHVQTTRSAGLACLYINSSSAHSDHIPWLARKQSPHKWHSSRRQSRRIRHHLRGQRHSNFPLGATVDVSL